MTAAAATPNATLPHVDECYVCQRCHFTADRSPSARPAAHAQAGAGVGAAELRTAAGLASRVAPSPLKWEAKRDKRNCTECFGCGTRLRQLKAVKAFGHQFASEAGASQDWLFLAGACVC